MRTLILIIAASAACGEPQAPNPTVPTPVATCAIDGSSNLPGVSIAFPGAACTFTLAEAAHGITIPYAVIVHDDLDGVIPVPRDSGGCARPGPSGLIVAEAIVGGDQRYCVCDTGLCPASDLTPVTIAAGTYAGAFAWDGVNWNGPSDTGNPKGAAFPPGDYTLLVTAAGTRGQGAFEVTGTLGVHLVP